MLLDNQNSYPEVNLQAIERQSTAGIGEAAALVFAGIAEAAAVACL